jgi:ubiquinone/menaquinone biosynthesis C-methylase UbiE
MVEFSRVAHEDTVLEVGAGTGNFLSLFEGTARTLLAADLTPAMLSRARAAHPLVHAVAADGAQLPFRDGIVDVVASAQMFHHVPEPVPVLREMRRVMSSRGRMLIVDQVATDKFEEALAMNELETIRDPSHAASRPRSAFHVMLRAAGLRVIDERTPSREQRFSDWMWKEEFPPERIDAVLDFIERRGSETGMGFRRVGDDWIFTRRRIMLLAEHA